MARARATATTRATRNDPHWRDLVLFHEYFHGDTGRGLGASHQTGWTALAVRCLGHKERRPAADQHQSRSGISSDGSNSIEPAPLAGALVETEAVP